MTAALRGELTARFDGDGVARVHASGPLELRGPLGASGLYYLRNVTAGVFAGDSYRTSVHCEAGGRARVESSSATKVYSMPSGRATVGVDVCAEAGSRVVWGPHATILHSGSALSQDTNVTVHAGARVVIAETLVMGRIAAGQRFDFTDYESSFVVHDAAGEPVYTEAYRLEPGTDLEAAMGGVGALTVVYALGAVEADAGEGLNALCAGRPLAGWSALPNRCGVVLKALTPSLSTGLQVAREAIEVLDVGAGLRASSPDEGSYVVASL